MDKKFDHTAGIWQIVFVSYLALVIVFSAWPLPENLNTGNDKINHFLAFLAFPVLVGLSYKNTPLWKNFLMGLCFGVFIEFIQLFVPGRSSEILDVAADCAGLAFGLIFFYLYMDPPT